MLYRWLVVSLRHDGIPWRCFDDAGRSGCVAVGRSDVLLVLGQPCAADEILVLGVSPPRSACSDTSSVVQLCGRSFHEEI